MRTTIRRPADSPWERAKMEQITRADIAAFGAGRAEMANAMLEQSGMRVRPDRNRGRAAGINPSGRFEPVSRHVFDDGWGSIEELPPFKTDVQVEKPRTIITRNDSPDISFDRSINPYRGCEHGCVYCFARPTHSYMGLSPGLDFESKLFAKPDAARLLDKELSKDGYEVEDDRHRHQHRPLPADREEIPHHARDPRSARGAPASGRHRHQVGAGDARHRHPCRAWRRRVWPRWRSR